MAYSGYGAPPFEFDRNPGRLLQEAPPYKDIIDVGEFTLTLASPVAVQAGMSARFTCLFVHHIDGPCGQTGNPWTVAPAVSVVDGNGNAVASSVIAIGTVNNDNNQAGAYQVVITPASTCPPGVYLVQWTATYTPVNDQEPQVALPILARAKRGFTVNAFQAPSVHFFYDTRLGA